MTKLPFCLQPSKPSDNNDYESYKKGEFELEEWEDVSYCEHSFSYGDKGLTDREVVDLLNELHEENEQLKSACAKYNINPKNLEKVLDKLDTLLEGEYSCRLNEDGEYE